MAQGGRILRPRDIGSVAERGQRRSNGLYTAGKPQASGGHVTFRLGCRDRFFAKYPPVAK
jgi:hypothetical protein